MAKKPTDFGRLPLWEVSFFGREWQPLPIDGKIGRLWTTNDLTQMLLDLALLRCGQRMDWEIVPGVWARDIDELCVARSLIEKGGQS